MSRYIDADALIEEFEWLKGVVNKYNRPHIEETIERINEAPTVDAVPVVHGRWEKPGGDLHSSGYIVCCSICNKDHFVHYKGPLGWLESEELFEEPNFCPNCGADMRERVDE